MRKVFIFAVILLMSVTLVACSSNKEEQGMANMPNPMVEYDSLEAVNDKLSIALVKPPVMGLSNEKYFVINEEIGEYDFTAGGRDYCFRASRDLNDISGVHIDEGTIFSGEAKEIEYYTETPYKAVRFVVDNIQYTLLTEDNGEMELEAFENVCSELFEGICTTISSADTVALVGDYGDDFSKRATAEVSLAGKDLLFVKVHWSSSASDADEWHITAKLTNSKLTYEMGDIEHVRYISNDVGDIETLYVDDAIPGYFEVNSIGQLLWTGSGIESTSACVFIKAIAD